MKKTNIPLDKVREIRYDINAVVELEDRFDVPIPELFASGKVGLKLIRSVLYIGLKHGGMRFAGRTLADDEEKVGKLIQEHWIGKDRTLVELMDRVNDAFEAGGVFATGDEEEEAEEAPNPEQGTDGQ